MNYILVFISVALKRIHLYVLFLFVYVIQTRVETAFQRTLVTEEKISKYLGSKINQLTKTVNILERETEKLLVSKTSQLDKEDYVSTPITALVMVRRLVQDWLPMVIRVTSLSKSNQFPLSDVRWPTLTDLHGAARAVKRSQLTYDLNTTSMVRGFQRGVFLGANVTAGDCFEIACQFFQKERFSEAREWLQHALAAVHETDAAPSRQTLLYFLAAALCLSGDETSSIKSLLTIVKENPLSNPPKQLTDYYNIMGSRGCVYPDKKIYNFLDLKYEKSGIDLNGVYFYRNKIDYKIHSSLCRGEGRMDPRLVCRYTHYHLPYLRFQPFKLEELQLEPPVIRFHDLLSDTDAQAVKALAKHKMKPANVGLERKRSEYRTSLVAWLGPNSTEGLTRRIADATRLDAWFSEYYQVQSYSVAGEYLPHRDYLGHDWTHDRLATIMFYLNDVDEGGHTVFTKWGLSVAPVKNSAVMWFNYKPNGEEDPSSLHSGCPVLKGTKWVVNKWVHNGGSHPLNFPCTCRNRNSFVGFYL